MKITSVKKKDDLQAIYDYDYDVFSDSLDFEWSIEGLRAVQKEGWTIHSCKVENEIVAILFTCIKENSLYTKNTPIKLSHQGNAYSDRIKEYYETMAKQKKLKQIFHYCRIDDFRMVSLNEDYGYKKTGQSIVSKGHLVEWIKKM